MISSSRANRRERFRSVKGKALHFVVQKHAASQLHFDFRLELDGVMKSWAVPKGPSLDPSVKRLAMEVEDHPISYNTFEGTIPQGEYGGGTVMLWDRGTYDAEDGGGVESLREGYRRGDLKFVLHGKRLRGSWVLVRMKRPGRPQWLLIKHNDEYANPKVDIVETETTSVGIEEEPWSGSPRAAACGIRIASGLLPPPAHINRMGHDAALGSLRHPVQRKVQRTSSSWTIMSLH